MSERAEGSARDVGEKIRRHRVLGKLRIVDLAERVSMSPSYISQVERGLLFPSVGSLQKIASALGLHVADFFQDGNAADRESRSESLDPGPRIVKRDSRKGLTYAGSNMIYQLLSPDLKGNIELLLIKAPSGGDSGETDFVHEGEECGFVLSGRMTYTVAGKTVVLDAGDSIYFKSSLPHRWSNSGPEELVAVWAISPPSF
ncbi:MAG: cupin domain-containing protein [Actinobacteria bacterium]|nr:cupin domain-containing protein [Actinomycetota bacterium]